MKEDQNIENFFRKRLENKEFNYQESDWVMLEQRLDAAATPGTGIVSIAAKKLIVIGAVILVATFFAGWFLNDYLSDTSQVGQSEVSEISETGSSTILDQPSSDERVNASTTEDARTAEDKSKEAGGNVVRAQGEEKVTKLSTHQDDLPVSENKAIHSLLSDEQEMVIVREGEDDPGNDTKYSEFYIDPVGYQELEILPNQNPELSLVTMSKLVCVAKERKFPNNLSIGVAFAPDFNGVGMAGGKTMTALIGGMVHYQVFPRWTVSGGVLLNRKKYETSGENYNPPAGYWQYQTSGTIPDNVDGSCQVLDIPLMVSFQWTSNDKFNIGSSVGISSYVLLDEHYEFQYGSHYNTSTASWDTEENSTILAGVANLSLSVSMRLSERLTFSAEPYLKKPLKEVGWGKIDLISTGTLFSLKYKPFRR